MWCGREAGRGDCIDRIGHVAAAARTRDRRALVLRDARERHPRQNRSRRRHDAHDRRARSSRDRESGRRHRRADARARQAHRHHARRAQALRLRLARSRIVHLARSARAVRDRSQRSRGSGASDRALAHGDGARVGHRVPLRSAIRAVVRFRRDMEDRQLRRRDQTIRAPIGLRHRSRRQRLDHPRSSTSLRDARRRRDVDARRIARDGREALHRRRAWRILRRRLQPHVHEARRRRARPDGRHAAKTLDARGGEPAARRRHRARSRACGRHAPRAPAQRERRQARRARSIDRARKGAWRVRQSPRARIDRAPRRSRLGLWIERRLLARRRRHRRERSDDDDLHELGQRHDLEDRGQARRRRLRRRHEPRARGPERLGVRAAPLRRFGRGQLRLADDSRRGRQRVRRAPLHRFVRADEGVRVRRSARQSLRRRHARRRSLHLRVASLAKQVQAACRSARHRGVVARRPHGDHGWNAPRVPLGWRKIGGRSRSTRRRRQKAPDALLAEAHDGLGPLVDGVRGREGRRDGRQGVRLGDVGRRRHVVARRGERRRGSGVLERGMSRRRRAANRLGSRFRNRAPRRRRSPQSPRSPKSTSIRIRTAGSPLRHHR